MTDKEKLIAIRTEVERRARILCGTHAGRSSDVLPVLEELLSFIDSLQKEPTGNPLGSTHAEFRTAVESLGISQKEHDRIVDELIYGKEPELVDVDDLPNKEEEPVSEDLKEEIGNYVKRNGYDGLDSIEEVKYIANYFAKWQKENLWKPADGDDLPEYDREVVVFTQNFPDDAGMMMVAIGHRPNPDGWDGKSITTGNVEHYTPMTYDKGGWNIPDVKFWLDCLLPNMED